MQTYLEIVLAREDSAKEVKLFELGPKLLARYREIFERHLPRGPARSRCGATRWGFALGLASTRAFYARLRLDRDRDRARRDHARRR